MEGGPKRKLNEFGMKEIREECQEVPRRKDSIEKDCTMKTTSKKEDSHLVSRKGPRDCKLPVHVNRVTI